MDVFQRVKSPEWTAFIIVAVSFVVVWSIVFRVAFKLTYRVSQLEDGWLAVENYQRAKSHSVNFSPRIGEPEVLEWIEK